MKATDVRGLSQNELNDRLVGLKKDLFFLRMQHATNQLDNPLRIAQVRKDIARVKTVIRQKELEELGGKS
jgi:large subunit ribosomal protein L29